MVKVKVRVKVGVRVGVRMRVGVKLKAGMSGCIAAPDSVENPPPLSTEAEARL